ncbi:hypothetical protein Dimus_011519 [Dionaea muscipula]
MRVEDLNFEVEPARESEVVRVEVETKKDGEAREIEALLQRERSEDLKAEVVRVELRDLEADQLLKVEWTMEAKRQAAATDSQILRANIGSFDRKDNIQGRCRTGRCNNKAARIKATIIVHAPEGERLRVWGLKDLLKHKGLSWDVLEKCSSEIHIVKLRTGESLWHLSVMELSFYEKGKIR